MLYCIEVLLLRPDAKVSAWPRKIMCFLAICVCCERQVWSLFIPPIRNKTIYSRNRLLFRRLGRRACPEHCATYCSLPNAPPKSRKGKYSTLSIGDTRTLRIRVEHYQQRRKEPTEGETGSATILVQRIRGVQKKAIHTAGRENRARRIGQGYGVRSWPV